MGKRKRKGKDDSAAGPLQLPPLPGLPPIPPPGGDGSLPLPPLGDLPPPGNIATLPVPEITPSPAKEDSDDYEALWAKRSEKPLQQIYGHIERIGSGEVGSLLDRYADRFGHELDRDIIIMRKKERADGLAEIRDAPTVKVIGEEEVVEDTPEGDDLASELKMVEDELRRLKPEYEAAKAEGDSKKLSELKPILTDLISMRKELKAMQSGDESIPEPVASLSEEEEVEEEVEEEEADDSADETIEEDRFSELVSIVDDLLGTHLPESSIEEFMASEDFDIYRTVGSDPASASEEQRSSFFSVVDARLGDMPDEAISEFVSSENFELYKEMGEKYS